MDLVRNEAGQGMVEYGLIIAFVAVVIITGLSLFGGSTNTLVSGAVEGLTPGS